MIDWKKKLTSRKFWVAVAGLVMGIIVICTSGATAETITGATLSFGSVVAYIIGEGLADSNKGGDKGGT